jgi:predicted kinase
MRIIYTVGLPASGKTTWALDYLRANPTTKRVNKDELRAMVDGGKWTHKNEKYILGIRDDLITKYLESGYDVIIDDTNFNPGHIAKFEEIAKEYKAEVVKKDFTHVTPEVCIERDLRRPNSVGHKVIMKMYNDYLRPKPAKQTNLELGLPTCILVDIDGTLAIMGDRSPFEWEKVGLDSVNYPVAYLVEMLYEPHNENPANEIILFSGRDGSCREQTVKWLSDNSIPYNKLFMREAGDMRKDNIVKREMYEAHINGKYNVRFVLDDRDQVVDMWRRDLGLTCLQVNYGDF